MPGAAPRRKGIRAERDFVNWLKSLGLDAQRVPLSGAAGGRYLGDISIRVAGGEILLEVKAIKSKARTLKKWMQSATALVIKMDRTGPGEWLVVIPATTFVRLVNGTIMVSAGGPGVGSEPGPSAG